MAGKAKFDQEAAFKSIIGQGSKVRKDGSRLRQRCLQKRKTGCSELIFWIGI